MSIMGGHKTAVKAIKVSSGGGEAISVSSDVAQVWNLATFERLRRLTINPQTPLADICYLSDELTVTAFRNSALFVWKGEECLFEMKTPPDVAFKITNLLYSHGQFLRKTTWGGVGYNRQQVIGYKRQHLSKNY